MALNTGLVGFSFTLAFAWASVAQTLDVDARDVGLAGAAAPLPDAASEAANPSLAAHPIVTRVVFSFAKAHALSDLTYSSVAATVVLTDRVAAGATVGAFGSEAFRRLTATISISTSVEEDLSLGIRGTVRRLAIPGYGSTAVASLSAGWRLSLSEHVEAGGAWRHVGAGLQPYDRLLPQELSIGASAVPVAGVRIAAALVRETASTLDLRVGVEFSVAQEVALRVGTGSHPDRFTLGLGIGARAVTIDIAASLHPYLGPSLAASVSLS